MTSPTTSADLLPDEEWLPAVGFEGHFDVSNMGRVRNTKTGRVLTGCRSGSGYRCVDLRADGVKGQRLIHRLVARAFLGEGEGGEVNHKNGNKTDNRVANLEWIDRAGNANHSRYVLGNHIKAVIAKCMVTGAESYFPSIEAADRATKFDASCISMVLNGLRVTHRKHEWRLAEEMPAFVADSRGHEYAREYVLIGERDMLRKQLDHALDMNRRMEARINAAQPASQQGEDFEFDGYCGTCGSPCNEFGQSVHHFSNPQAHPTGDKVRS